jgi:HPt (histidine-containing phosphotransfer) domain-containing protein
MDVPSDILDLAALRRNFGEDLAFAGRLAVKFEGRYPEQLAAVRDALARGEGTPAGEAAHRLAGETSVFYAVAARQAALAVEDLARAGQLAEAAAACVRLDSELRRLATTLQQLASAPL